MDVILRELVELRADREAKRADREATRADREATRADREATRADREATRAVLEGINMRLAAVERGVGKINKRLAAVERGVGKTNELGVRAAIGNKRNQDYPLPALLNDGEPWCRDCVGQPTL